MPRDLFLLKRDFFQADFAIREKEDSRGVYGKRTVLYDHYQSSPSKYKIGHISLRMNGEGAFTTKLSH